MFVQCFPTNSVYLSRTIILSISVSVILIHEFIIIHCFQCLNSFLFSISLSFCFSLRGRKTFSISYYSYYVNRIAIKYFELPKLGWQSKIQEFQKRKNKHTKKPIRQFMLQKTENNPTICVLFGFQWYLAQFPISYSINSHKHSV